jgi:hypothetical protein
MRGNSSFMLAIKVLFLQPQINRVVYKSSPKTFNKLILTFNKTLIIGFRNKIRQSPF